MSFLKATIAGAAVVTCCLGNQYPAKSYETLQLLPLTASQSLEVIEGAKNPQSHD